VSEFHELVFSNSIVASYRNAIRSFIKYDAA
jgi:hypothetical protein